ncbi:MAG: hypothetical protein AB1767_10240 [Bacillota bacterium]
MFLALVSRFSYSRSLCHLIGLAAALNRPGINTILLLTNCPPAAREAYRDYCRYKTPLFFADRNEEIAGVLRHRQIDLLHLHSPELLPITLTLARQLRVPFGVSLPGGPLPARQSGIEQASFIIMPSPAAPAAGPGNALPVTVIPQGIDLEEYQPGPKNGNRITFIAEPGAYSRDAYFALLKAAGLTEFRLAVITPEQPPADSGAVYHRWQPATAAVLQGSQIVIGRGHALLEGLACGNAALVLGHSYKGLCEPAAGRPVPGLSDQGGAEPCYRNIFFDLSRLWQERAYLEHLQQWGRRFARENCDVRLTAEMTLRLYRRALSRNIYS